MLEASLERETKKIYTNLKPWDRVQIARFARKTYDPRLYSIYL